MVGLINDANLGDPAIFQITQHTIKEYYQKRQIHVSFKCVDIENRTLPVKMTPALSQQYERVRNWLWQRLRKRPFKEYDRVKLACIRNIRKGTNAVIIVGGSLIKFKHQKYLHRMIDIVTSRADQLNIPVMFSGIGVEGYDDSSEICQRLRISLNRRCVKVITVRDDIKTMRDFYLNTNNPVRTVKVSDAACSLANLYFPSVREKNVVGIGIIRGDIFAEYGNQISDDDLLKLYAEIYNRVLKFGKKCIIFSNGTPKDQKFAERLVSYLDICEDAKILCSRPQTVQELVSIITRCEALIATRLHAGIIAFAYEISFVELVWNQKQKFFGESIGFPDRFFDVLEFNAVRIVEKLLNAIDTGYPNDMQAYRKSNSEELEDFLTDFIG